MEPNIDLKRAGSGEQGLGHAEEPQQGQEKVTPALLLWASPANVCMLDWIF